MGKYKWPEIKLFSEAMRGLEAIEKLTGEVPTVLLSKEAQAKWEASGKMTSDFYALDLQQRLNEAGYASNPPQEHSLHGGEK